MIGTKDLKIQAQTYDNKEIIIFENGNFNIWQNNKFMRK
jgi:hypothetical protein